MNTQKKPTFKWSYIIMAMVAIVFVFFIFGTPQKSGKQLTYSQAQQKLNNGEIVAVYGYDTTIKMLLKNSQVEISAFPKKCDYYIETTSQKVEEFMSLVSKYNASLPAGATLIQDEYPPIETSFMEYLWPVMYIGLAVIVLVFIFKMFSSSNKNAIGFGKSKARTVTNIKVKFEDIAGADEEKTELKEIVEFLKSPQKFKDMGARIPKGVLLVGSPGTGKTLLARAVAGESDVPFLSISGSDFVEMFVGVGASRVRDLFEQAKKMMPCIVFIDEIDAVGRQRGAGLGGGNDEREQTLNQLLVEMDGFEANDGIIVLAATNRSDVLDPALLRPGRFDRQIYVHMPDVRGREGIIKIHAKNKPLESDVDFKTLARITSGFTGADIENMLNESAILAAREGRVKIKMIDLQEGINKVLMGPQKKSLLITERDKKLTAIHESGHAVLSKNLKFCEEVQEVSIIPRGSAAGYTMNRPDNDDHHMTQNKLNDQIAMMMGGRVAEELIVKDISTGAQNDIQRATELATKMVKEWGMSKKLGFANYSNENQIFIGRDYQNKTEYSEKTAGQIDDEIRDILSYNYARAKKILTANKEKLNQMTELLLKVETIYKEEVDMIMSGKKSLDIAKKLEKQIAIQKQSEEKDKSNMIKEKTLKAMELKMKTAEQYLKNGIISKEDYNAIEIQFNKIKSEINEEEKAVVLKEKKVKSKKIDIATTNLPKAKKAKEDFAQQQNAVDKPTEQKTPLKAKKTKKDLTAEKAPKTELTNSSLKKRGRPKNKDKNDLAK